MKEAFRVVHYLNQFFGGIGGEERAFEKPQMREGLIGMGRAMEAALEGRGRIVATVVCGDNYFAEKTEQAIEEILRLMVPCKPDLLIAGPAFYAGRYGIACGELCKAVQERLGIVSVTGMYEENPGVELYRRDVYIIKTPESARHTTEIATRMVNLVLRLASKEKIGLPSEEGYFPRGIILDEWSTQTAAERAVSMLLAKIQGGAFESEMETPKFGRVKPPPAIENLAQAKIALVTDGGLIPRGNPDKMESYKSYRFASYDIQTMEALSSEDFEAHHVGYDKTYVNENPNRMIPLDVMRDLEKEGVIGALHNRIYSTAGVATSLASGRKIGQAIAEDLNAAGVNGVILTSTWGTSTRCGAAMATTIEKTGIPVAHITTMTPIAVMVGSNRIIPGAGVIHPLGDAELDPQDEKVLRRNIVKKALEALQTELTEQRLFPTSGL